MRLKKCNFTLTSQNDSIQVVATVTRGINEYITTAQNMNQARIIVSEYCNSWNFRLGKIKTIC